MPATKRKPGQPDQGMSALAGAMMGVNPKAMEAWGEIMNGSARFLADRLQKDQEAQKALLACKTPAELIEVQSAFVSEAIEQYTAEAARVFEKMSEAAGESFRQATSSLARGYDDVPL